MNNRLTVDSSSSSVPFMLLRKGVGVQVSYSYLHPSHLRYCHDDSFLLNRNINHLFGASENEHSTLIAIDVGEAG